MSVLAALRQDRAGEWTSLDEYLRELRRRETGALAALASLLSSTVEERRELALHGTAGADLLEVASDLRVPKGARIAAARCLLDGGIEPPFVGHLFVGAGDLVTDPRLGGGARKLVEAGLPAALQLGGEAAQISLLAGSFARAVQASASAVGQSRVAELLAAAPPLHAGAIAGGYAIGLGELPEAQRTGWQRLLAQTCAAHRRAPAAARRVGLAPAWPPSLPDAFAPLLREAERETAGDVPPGDVAREKPAPVPAPRPAAKKDVAPLPPGKTLAPAIKRSAFRRPRGTVVEVPAGAPVRPANPGAAQAPPPREQPRARFDRWSDDVDAWKDPVLPEPRLRSPARARPATRWLAERMRAIFDDLPEAVDRLCAAAEARAAIASEEALGREIARELSREVWRGRTLPASQAQRLHAVAADPAQPSPWRAAARRIVDFFVPESG